MKTAVVIGVDSDQGLGAQLCKRFAANGLRIVVAGTSKSAIESVALEVLSSGGKALAFVADPTNEADIIALFNVAGPAVDLAIYNAGNRVPRIVSAIYSEAEQFEQVWRGGCFGGYLFGREAIRRMRPNERGTLLFAGASASLSGLAGYAPFGSAKGALRVLAQALAKEYAGDGIHVGHVIVDGGTPDDVHPAGNVVRGDDTISINVLVDAFAHLYNQPRWAWSFELDVRASKEN
ncbi:SDR family NAD(P)-dependent oxidoreductase [Bradyrhizobium sp. CCBAU 53338]|uniref:SDR family NAD(P)-dependent oxidoreductase n=1 Tax=Bradyrhizobium sp. CCBAU 53338 TaxID=1325111 RepID=UPI00188C980B|nr:SDR family NAD(P)-dependent oxidoreductase [Bradyrhizobium sp. CCBAU 53338]QOZ51490.1 glucose 1-dehydrogenase [Bradyrhizobium sp. CCBAU 53338]